MTDASGGRIRVLIVDDDAEMRENLKKLMTLESDIEVVGAATGGSEGVQMAAELKPDVITMDINMQDMDGLEATRRIISETRRVAIIMLSVQHDMQYFRRAMQVGACDFLTKPPEMDELIGTIRRCYEGLADVPDVQEPVPTPTQRVRGQGHIIAVYGPKGGVGATTIATSLGIGLARRGGTVALIDADMQFGDVGIFLNMRLPNSIADLTAEGDEPDIESLDMVMGNHNSGARVLLAPRSPELAEYVMSANVKSLVSILKGVYEFVIVDTGTSVDEFLLSVLDVADKLIIVSTPDIPSLKNVSLFYELLDLINFPAEQSWFVLNRLMPGSPINAERVAERLNRSVVGEIHDDPVHALRAVNAGEALVNQDAGKAPSVKGLVDLVKFIEGEIQAELAEREAEQAGDGRVPW